MTKVTKTTKLVVITTTTTETTSDPPPRRHHPSGVRRVIDTTGEEVGPGIAKVRRNVVPMRRVG